MLKKIKNCLFYASLERGEWLQVRNLARQENRFLLTVISAAMFAIMGLLAVYTRFFDTVYPENAVAYASIAFAELVLFFLAKVVAARFLGIVPVLVVVFNVSMYVFGMAIGTYFDAENYALAFVIMIIVLPMLFCVPPIASTGLVVLMDGVFLWVSHGVKAPSVFEVDVMNIVVWTIVGLFLNCITTSARYRSQWMILKRTKAQVELQGALDILNSRMDIFRSLGNVYAALYYVDLQKDSYEELASLPETRAYFGLSGSNASLRLREFCERIVVKKHQREMSAFTDMSTISERLSDHDIVSSSFLSKVVRDANNDLEWAEFNIIAVNRDVNSKVTSVLVAARKIHDEKMRELKQMESLQAALSAAEAANRSKTVFLNSMSHDIRTPMNAITGFTGLAQAHIDDKELVKDYLDKVSVANKHLLSLINDVLDMSRIESGRVNLNLEPVSVATIVDELKTILLDDVKARQLTLNVDIHDLTSNFVYCDKLRLKQILLNLLSNAVKFTEKGGRIDLIVKDVAASVSGIASYEFVVRDTGIGMSEEFAAKVFQPFEREATSTVSGIQGTGLGMSISKSLVDMMGGRISVKSQLGLGSEFTVLLSFKVAEENNVRASARHTEALPVVKNLFEGRRILLVEDNSMNQMIALHMLKETGVELDIAENGLEACDVLKERGGRYYDVVLMDIQMPVMDGYSATQRIREMSDPELSRIPVVAMTANAFEEDKERALSVGMCAHIPKPVEVKQLMSVLNSVFEANPKRTAS